jgi:hypothetical protein
MEVMHTVFDAEIAGRLQREPMSAVKVIIDGRPAIVTAATWHPATGNSGRAVGYIRAEVFELGERNPVLDGTPAANDELRDMIGRLEWLPGEFDGTKAPGLEPCATRP